MLSFAVYAGGLIFQGVIKGALYFKEVAAGYMRITLGGLE
jgi:hypothetical protein